MVAFDNALFTIGEITGVHGVKGGMRVRSFADSNESFIPGEKVLIRPKKKGKSKRRLPMKQGAPTETHQIKGKSQGDRFDRELHLLQNGLDYQWYEIERVSPHKKGLLLMLEGVDRNSAETLVGREILMPRDALPDLEEDTYYWQDLIGLTVMDLKHGELGVVDHVMPTGSNDVYVVKGKGKEVLVPALAWVVQTIDLERREMIVDLPDELLE